MFEDPAPDSPELKEFKERLSARKAEIQDLLREMKEEKQQTESATSVSGNPLLRRIFDDLPDMDSKDIAPVLSAFVKDIDPNAQLYVGTEGDDGSETEPTLVLTY